MTTQQTTWTVYPGSGEQIVELLNTKDGFIFRYSNGDESHICKNVEVLNGTFLDTDTGKHLKATHYWIIPADPLREMKIRWSMTGQPVWIREHLANYFDGYLESTDCYDREPTTTPDWNIPNAEYSFKPWED